MTTATTRTVILWDIDGTLLTTQRAGIRAWEDAVYTVTGRTVDLQDLPTSGLTDLMIARVILSSSGAFPERDTERRLAAEYAAALPQRLTERRGWIIPGVVDILDDLSYRSDVLLGLLTGNLRDGARAKLQSYGLQQYFTFGGFADDGFDRVEIGRVALNRARSILGNVELGPVFLVGDSPYDVRCASALGLKMIAVASGIHTLEELDDGTPWWCLRQLPPPPVFAERLQLVGCR